MTRTFDYIIVGAGSAGCVLANKLSASGRDTVLLVEAGPADKNPMIHMPKGFGQVATSKRHTWYYRAMPGTGGSPQTQTWISGRMLGGSSSINGMQYQRGHKQDYDHWQHALGLKGWGWDDVLRIYLDMEDHELGAGDLRSAGGPVPVTLTKNRTRFDEKLIEAGGQMGLSHKRDANELDPEGIGYMSATIRNGKRWSAAKAFLNPAKDRRNLTVLTDTETLRILLHQHRATGIECIRNGGKVKYQANREVIVSAGALNTPRLLQMSGIGYGAHLSALGIPVVLDLPEVGRNLREHCFLTTQFRVPDACSQNKQYSGPRLLRHALQYMLFHNGLMSYPPFDINAFIKTRPALTHTDIQLIAGPLSVDLGERMGFSGGWENGIAMEKQPGASILACILQPKSEGSVRISGPQANAPLEITHNILSHRDDCETAIATIRYIRQLARQPALRSVIQMETMPGPSVDTDDAILDYCMRTCGPGYHPSGTCRMGTHATSVVDERLRVRNIAGLRIADMSVAPTLLSGNTNAPAMMIGWRASDIIREDAIGGN